MENSAYRKICLRLFVCGMLFIIAGIVIFVLYYFHLQHPLMKDFSPEISSKIDTISEIGKLQSLCHSLLADDNEVTKNVNQALDSLIQLTLTIIFCAASILIYNAWELRRILKAASLNQTK